MQSGPYVPFNNSSGIVLIPAALLDLWWTVVNLSSGSNLLWLLCKTHGYMILPCVLPSSSGQGYSYPSLSQSQKKIISCAQKISVSQLVIWRKICGNNAWQLYVICNPQNYGEPEAPLTHPGLAVPMLFTTSLLKPLFTEHYAKYWGFFHSLFGFSV